MLSGLPFKLLAVSLATQKSFGWSWPQWLFFFFWLFLTALLVSHPRSCCHDEWWNRFPPVFSRRNLIISGLMLQSSKHSQPIWGKDHFMFFACEFPVFSVRDCSLSRCVDMKISWPMCVVLFHWSICLCLWLYHSVFDHSNFSIYFEIRNCGSVQFYLVLFWLSRPLCDFMWI